MIVAFDCMGAAGTEDGSRIDCGGDFADIMSSVRGSEECGLSQDVFCRVCTPVRFSDIRGRHEYRR